MLKKVNLIAFAVSILFVSGQSNAEYYGIKTCNELSDSNYNLECGTREDARLGCANGGIVEKFVNSRGVAVYGCSYATSAEQYGKIEERDLTESAGVAENKACHQYTQAVKDQECEGGRSVDIIDNEGCPSFTCDFSSEKESADVANQPPEDSATPVEAGTVESAGANSGSAPVALTPVEAGTVESAGANSGSAPVGLTSEESIAKQKAAYEEYKVSKTAAAKAKRAEASKSSTSSAGADSGKKGIKNYIGEGRHW